MRRQIRFGVFETNSSSVHSLTIVSKEEYEDFKNGEAFMSCYDEKLISKEEVIKMIKKENEHFDENEMSDEDFCDFVMDEYELVSYERYGEDYEYFVEHKKTKSGDEVVAFGYYGYN